MAVLRTETERPFIAAKGFNTNLIHFLLPYHAIISNVHICSFSGTISHVDAQNLVYEKLSTNCTWLYSKTFDSFIFLHFNLNILY